MDTGGGNLGEAGIVLPDGGSLTDESGTGSVTPPDTVAAKCAGIKSATALSETQIGVTWEAATDDKTAQGTIAYRIYVAEVAGGQIFTSPVVTAPAGATGATIASLHAFKQYFIVVRSVDGSGNETGNVGGDDGANTNPVHRRHDTRRG